VSLALTALAALLANHLPVAISSGENIIHISFESGGHGGEYITTRRRVVTLVGSAVLDAGIQPYSLG
jgi:hypothetical protein